MAHYRAVMGTTIDCEGCKFDGDKCSSDEGCIAFSYWDNNGSARECTKELAKDVLTLLKKQEAVVHPEPSCEMEYVTDCCCDLCGVQLIREDNFCRGCGKPIDWNK